MSCSHFARDASKMTSGYTKFLLVTLLVASMGDSAVAFLETPRPLALRARYAASGLSRRLNTRVLASSLPSEALIAEEDGQKSLDEKPQHSKRLVVRFDDRWVDLTGWRKAHPAGEQWIDEFAGMDATEVMTCFHSDTAMAMLARLPTAKAEDVPTGVPEVTPLTRSFRALRAELKRDGWFVRKPWLEAAQAFSWAAVLGLGISLAGHNAVFPALGAMQQQAAWATGVVCLALANSYAGWLAHDYVHGTDKFVQPLRHFGGLAAGYSATMWSNKHNLHHAKTNEVGIDQDLPGGPVLFIWPPSPANDKPWRKYQHMYLPFAYSLLFVLWRVDSVKVALANRNTKELLALGAHYGLAALAVPLTAFLPAVLLSGLVSATIVTVSHQTEELLGEHEHDWVRNQFLTTRDAHTANFFTEWLWGGMQYQLLHHLFPDMPRYYYPALRPKVEALAAEHNIEYRQMDEWPLLLRNLKQYRDVALAPPDLKARLSAGGVSV